MKFKETPKIQKSILFSLQTYFLMIRCSNSILTDEKGDHIWSSVATKTHSTAVKENANFIPWKIFLRIESCTFEIESVAICYESFYVSIDN